MFKVISLSLFILSASTIASVAVGKNVENKGFEKEGSGFESDGKKVKNLVDDKGQGEYVPRIMVEISPGINGASDIAVKNGLSIGAAVMYRPTGDFWAGAVFDFRYIFGENTYERISDISFALTGRWYFMPHKEANRFIMSWLLVELGYNIFNSTGTTGNDINIKTKTSGPQVALGIGVARALSTRSYIGLTFKYTIPLWGDVCAQRGNSDEECISSSDADFETSFWQFSFNWTISF